MNTLNPSAAKLTRRHTPLIPSLNHRRPVFSKPPFSPCLRFPPPPLPQLSLAPVRASWQNPNHENPNKTLKVSNSQITDKNAAPGSSLVPFFTPLKAAVVTTITTAALIFSGFCFYFKPSIAAPLSPPPTVETAEKDSVLDEEREKLIEEHLVSDPNNVDGLKNLMEIKIKNRKIPEAIGIIEKLMELEPEEIEWPMMRAHVYVFSGDFARGKNGFDELLKKDPFCVRAYHGLVTVASEEKSSEELKNIERRVEEMIRLCKKQNKKSDMRDFKLLLAQIKVIESRYDEALRAYQDLVKDEPRDYRPYLCQGIIYTLLRKNNEAEKNFEKYRRLVPKGHPYASFFDDTMIASKVFSEKVKNERDVAKS